MAQRGRPRNFDRETALTLAMEIFWSKGYTGTQLTDLTTAMNINPPSFYATFGSKRQLFYEAVDLYIKVVGSKSMLLLNQASTAESGIRAMLEATIRNVLSNQVGGCLLMLGVVNHLSGDDDEWVYLKNIRKETLSIIKSRIERGISDGDLPVDTNANTLASFFLGIIQAISFQARDGVKASELKNLIEPAMAVFRVL